MRLGRQLRYYFEPVVNDPLPPRIADLMARLKELYDRR